MENTGIFVSNHVFVVLSVLVFISNQAFSV